MQAGTLSSVYPESFPMSAFMLVRSLLCQLHMMVHETVHI